MLLLQVRVSLNLSVFFVWMRCGRYLILISPYRVKRLLMDPWADPFGSGYPSQSPWLLVAEAGLGRFR